MGEARLRPAGFAGVGEIKLDRTGAIVLEFVRGAERSELSRKCEVEDSDRYARSGDERLFLRARLRANERKPRAVEPLGKLCRAIHRRVSQIRAGQVRA